MIKREAEYRTHTIGRAVLDGMPIQFMAFVVATLPRPAPKNWERHKRWYGVVHLFDQGGRHLRTEAQYAGTTADGEGEVIDRARELQNQLMAPLSQIDFCDVMVELFATRIEGKLFGLVDSSRDGLNLVTLWPNDLLFYEPWDGTYDT